MALRLRSSAFSASTRTAALRTFTTTTPHQRGLFVKERDDTMDPGKESTDSVDKAKDDRGATPAQQQANVTKQQNPGDAGQRHPAASQTQANMDKGHSPGGLSKKKDGQKSGEEAVNPAVKAGKSA